MEVIANKVLLAVLPLWDKLIPPLGISCLKEFLTQHRMNVKTVDLNTEEKLKDSFDEYFRTLKGLIPGEKKGNFNNISHDVVHEHMMARINREDEEQYIRLVKEIVYQTFFHTIEDQSVLELDKIIDAYYRHLENYLLHLLDKEKPTILGLSVYSSTLPSSLFAFRLTKNKYPEIKTVMGGGIFTNQLALGSPNLDFFLEKTKDYIDTLIVGEGELLFLKYLNGELPSSQRVYTLNDVGGELLDLSSVDIPDYSGFNLDYYQYVALYGSRSCPLNCSFCSETVTWGKFRKKKAGQIVKELEKIHKTHGTQLFLMCDSLLNPVISDISKELIESGSSFYWDGYLRADKSVGSIDNTIMWRQAGFYRARLGLESGSSRILEAMKKRITPAQIIEAVSNLAYAGVKTTTYWIVGYPGETEEDFQQTLALLTELKDKIYEADVNPFGYTLTGQVDSDGWRKENNCLLLYPESAKDMLITQTWYLDCAPSREETYRRMRRFVEHCEKLGIPNNYSVYDVYNADRRWKKLHKNAVPLLVDFEDSNGYIDENKKIKKLNLVQNAPQDEGDFDF